MGYVFKNGVLTKKEDSEEQKPAGTSAGPEKSKPKDKSKKEEKSE